MIISFANKLAEDLFEDKNSKEVRSFQNELLRSARRKILYLHDAAELVDLKVPPGNKLEALKGTLLDSIQLESITSGDQFLDGIMEMQKMFQWKITTKT